MIMFISHDWDRMSDQYVYDLAQDFILFFYRGNII
jgi:hypothetical protein